MAPFARGVETKAKCQTKWGRNCLRIKWYNSSEVILSDRISLIHLRFKILPHTTHEKDWEVCIVTRQLSKWKRTNYSLLFQPNPRATLQRNSVGRIYANSGRFLCQPKETNPGHFWHPKCFKTPTQFDSSTFANVTPLSCHALCKTWGISLLGAALSECPSKGFTWTLCSYN